MISLSEKLLYNTTRLEGNKANGENTVGTGFIFSYKSRFFLITNKHVIDGVVDGEFILHKTKIVDGEQLPDHGKGISVKFNQTNFIGHPVDYVDVTVMNISDEYNRLIQSGDIPYILTVSESIIPSSEDMDKFIKPIEDIIFVGYPSGIWDSFNLMPIMRKGITATPYQLNFMGQEVFLIDASVFPGSSGSPVFIYYSGSYSDKSGSLFMGDRIYFIGIVAKVYQRKEQGNIIMQDIPTAMTPVAVTNQMIDLGIVFKAPTVIEAMNNYIEIANKNDQQSQTAG